MGLLLVGRAPKSGANEVHLETMGPLGLDQDPKRNLEQAGTLYKCKLVPLNTMEPLELDGPQIKSQLATRVGVANK